jgi:hypothetical protein
MREIRTYGLTRGRWPVRLARRAGVYSTDSNCVRFLRSKKANCQALEVGGGSVMAVERPEAVERSGIDASVGSSAEQGTLR